MLKKKLVVIKYVSVYPFVRQVMRDRNRKHPLDLN